MFSLVRSGPKILVFKTGQIERLRHLFEEALGAKEYDLNTAFDRATENYTILFIAEEMEEVLEQDQIKEILMVKEEADMVLCRLIKADQERLIKDVRTAPRILILRVLGEMDQIMSQIQEDMGGELGSFKHMLDSGSQYSTLVSLTDKPLNRNMRISDLFNKTLKLEGSHTHFLKELRMHAMKYLNASIGNKDWHEIEIRIFDRYSAYELHYDRLIELFEALELGLVLGESWSKDYPRLFMAVEVYRVRFFTFHEPKFIKQMLLGMEYTSDGTRIVDYDVYMNHKKMDWTEVLTKEDPKNRLQAGVKYRQQIFDKLSASAIEELERLETEVLKTRI